jgi:hypothetical protein
MISNKPPVISECSYLVAGDKCFLSPFEDGAPCSIYTCARLDMSVKVALVRMEGLDD